MTLVYACIAPHGGEIVPALAGRKLRAFQETREGMKRLASDVLDARPDTIVVASPHNVRLMSHIAVVMTENGQGSVGGRISLRAKCDTKLAEEIFAEADRAGLPVEGVRFAVPSGPLSVFQLDFGSLIPLWFFTRMNGLKPKVVVLAPSRGVSPRAIFEFGRAVGRAVDARSERVAFVASADQAHAHKKSGPYGYSERAAEYDRRVAEAVRRNRLKSIMKFPAEMIESAKPDSFWQMVMLAGVIEGRGMRLDLYSYQVPTYYGMMCVACTKTRESRRRAGRSPGASSSSPEGRRR